MGLRVEARRDGRFLPLDRRDLQQHHVDHALANVLATCVKLNLWSRNSVGRDNLIDLSRYLFKLVKRRHTHLWTSSLPPQA